MNEDLANIKEYVLENYVSIGKSVLYGAISFGSWLLSRKSASVSDNPIAPIIVPTSATEVIGDVVSEAENIIKNDEQAASMPPTST
jgi:hypothetical protein